MALFTLYGFENQNNLRRKQHTLVKLLTSQTFL